MRLLIDWIGHTRFALICTGSVLLGVVATWVAIGTAHPVRAVSIGILLAIFLALQCLVVVLLAVIVVPQYERLRASITANAGAAWALDGWLNGQPRPTLGGWAIDPAAAVALVRLLGETSPKRVLELGPGASTRLLVDWAESRDTDIISLEHSHEHYLSLQTAFAREIGTGRLDLRLAPLEPLAIDSWRGRWYGTSSFPDISEIDLLLVDGPPGATSGRARFPAIPVLREYLLPGCYIFVDDTSRPSERAVVDSWRTQFGLEVHENGTNHTVLRVPDAR